jgi:hypothetical protein
MINFGPEELLLIATITTNTVQVVENSTETIQNGALTNQSYEDK